MIYKIKLDEPSVRAKKMFHCEPTIAAAISDFCLLFDGLEQFLENLIENYSLMIVNQGEPVIKTIFRECFANYYLTNIALYPDQKMANVLADILNRIALSMCLSIRDQDHGSIWTHQDSCGLTNWLRESKGINFSVDIQLSPLQQKKRDYQRLVPDNIKFYLRRFNHENSILGRSLDIVL